MERAAPTGRTRCRRRSGGRSPAAPARPGVASWNRPRQRSSSRSPGRPSAGRSAASPPSRPPSQARNPSRLGLRSRGRPTEHPLMLSCAPTCRRALARRQRHRRLGIRQRPRGSSALKRTAIAHPDHPLRRLPRAPELLGLLGVVAAYTYYANGLPNPEAALTDLDFDQQTIVDRPDRHDRARPPRRAQARGRHLRPSSRRRSSTRRPRSRTRTSGTTRASTSPGSSRPTVDTINGRPRGGSTITQQLVRARLLPPSAFDGSREERKIREIIQSIRLTQAYPGEKGKQQIITAYLNQNFYGNQSYGVKAAARQYFGKDLKDLTLAEDAILAAIPQSPDEVRPREERRADLRRGRPRPAARARSPSSSSRPTAEVVTRRNYILDRMKTESPLCGPRHTARRVRGREG